MRLERWAGLVAVAGLAAGCATAPPPARAAEAAPAPAAPTATLPQPTVERPPIQSVEPPAEIARPAPAPIPEVAPPAPPASVEPSSVPAVPSSPEPSAVPAVPPSAEPSTVPAVPPSAEPSEDQQLTALLADLQRYGALGPDDVKRELGMATQALAKQRSDAMRLRVAVLYTLVKASPQDDQRALQMLEAVTKNNPGSPGMKQLAAVLQAQIAERMRAVRDEQAKADAATKKLDALRSMERDLLRDRVRGGGGGGGGGGSSGGGGGGGGG